jgi:2,4-dienoyl-CoA reductase-like NADH-dependent reductase (Old Yellow Enzyme family)
VRFGDEVAPGDLSGQEIRDIIAACGRAAAICQEAGFDGVEVHGAHDYVLNQFFMPEKNRRLDDYGGSLENRSRLAIEIVRQIRKTVGSRFAILYRHTPTGAQYTIEDSFALVRRLIEVGLDVLDISPARNTAVADMAAPFKANFDLPVIAVGGMQDPEKAARALREGRCDLVAVGRQMIADSQWPKRVREGRLDQLRRCEKCQEGCFGNLRRGTPVECVTWETDEVELYLDGPNPSP